MSINMTIRSGTTRTFPQEGDSDLYGEVTSWANDVTTAINASPTSDETATFDAIVGTAANVTAGIATHSDIATAIAAVSANDRIYLLENTFEPAAQIDINKALTIIGQGEGVDIQGDNIATGAVVKISASGVTFENVKITQGTGTPDYALEFSAAIERININIKADGTFATALFLNGSVAGAITGFISYDTNSVLFAGEYIEVEQLRLEDQTTPAWNLVLESDSDTDVLSANRTLTIDVHDGDRVLDLNENFSIGDGYDVTITAEDVASSIVLDEQTFEVEGEGTATRLFKLVNSSDSARTLSFAADVTATGNDLTIAVEDAASSITLDNCSLEVEDTIGSGNTIKFIIGTDDASRTVTLSENLVIGDGFDVTLTAEDAASSIVLDEQSFEVEGEGTATRLFKLVNSSDSARTLTFAADVTATGNALTLAVEDAAGSITLDNCSLEIEDTIGSGNTIKFIIGTDDASRTVTLSENLVIGDGADVTITAEDAASSVTLDNCSLEVEDTIGSGNTIKFIIGTDDASRTVTLSENLVIGDGFDVTLTAEDAASSITLDEQNFEVEGEGTTNQLLKLVNANNAAATLTLEGTAAVVNQDTTSDADVTFNSVTTVVDIDTPLVTNDSADVTVSTTTSGDVNLNSVDETVVISSTSDTSATTNTVKFGDDTGGISGIRNINGELQYNTGGAGWTAFNSEGGINYIANGSAEVDTTGWAVYADVAGNIPVDGIGGAPTVTWTRDTTTPLRGTGEFVLTKDAADRQGEGASYDFTIDPADIHSVLSISFDATTSADYADDDVILYIYNVDSSVGIEPVPMELKAGEYGRYSAQFQTSDADNSYRLIFHVSSTNASAYTINVDNIKVGPSARNFGAPITEWSTDFAMTLNSDTNVTTNTGYWRRVGDSLHFKGYVKYGGAGDNSSFSVTFPDSLEMDPTRIGYEIGKSIIGYGNWWDQGTDMNCIMLVPTSASAFSIVIDQGGAYLNTNTFAASDTISFDLHVPILGWGSSVQMSDTDSTRIVAARYTRAAALTLTNATPVDFLFDTLDKDTHSAYNTTTGEYTIPVAGGYHITSGITLAATATFSGTESLEIYVYLNGVAVQRILSFPNSNNTQKSENISVTLPGLVKGDVVKIGAYQNSGGDLSSYTVASNNWFSIFRVTGPSAIAANELVAARYDTDAGQSIDNASAEIVNFDSTTFGYDTHGMVTVGAGWAATAVISGKYKISTLVTLVDTAWTAGEIAILYLYVNGTETAWLDYYECETNGTYTVVISGDTTVALTKGDYVDIRVYQNTGAGVALAAFEERNWMSIERIGF